MEKPIEEIQKGEQMPLIDVLPENIKPIIPIARAYKKVVAQRVQLTAKEVELKTKIKDMARKAKIPRLDDGSIKITHDGVQIVITPQDEKVKVSIDDE